MNILVIGNGFDLAHDLPTKYINFLEFCERVKRIYTYAESEIDPNYIQEYILDIKINKEILDILNKAIDNHKEDRENATCKKVLDEFYSHIDDNIWLQYFLRCRFSMGKNWIDFEQEISKAIQSLDKYRKGLNKDKTIDDLPKENKKILMALFEAAKGSMEGRYRDIKAIDKFADSLNTELKRLIRALEIYIVEFVGSIAVSKNKAIEKLDPDCVLSFNYSDTHEKVYGNGRKIEYDYIHGKADMSNTMESNNMVLGIDEYLGKKERSKNVEFITFKKYYQRIYKQTGCKYKEWVDEIIEDKKEADNYYGNVSNTQMSLEQYRFKNKCHNLYIFGHSLDVTDKDILKKLILNDNVKTTIFYPDKEDLGRKIANLVKVIGQDKLIKRTGGNTKTIEFMPQQDMVPIEN